jgi:hypothetical protein
MSERESILHLHCVFVIELLEEPIGKTQPHTLSAARKKGITAVSLTRLIPS